MGNSPSSMDVGKSGPKGPRPPQKLSKPRTGNHTGSTSQRLTNPLGSAPNRRQSQLSFHRNSIASSIRTAATTTTTHLAVPASAITPATAAPYNPNTKTLPPPPPLSPPSSSVPSPVETTPFPSLPAPLPPHPHTFHTSTSTSRSTPISRSTSFIARHSHSKVHQPDWDYTFDEKRDSIPILGRRQSIFKFLTPDSRDETRHHKRRDSGRLSRSSSVVYNNEVGANYYGEAIIDNWPAQASKRSSINYDLLSYEAKRLINLPEPPLFAEGGSIMSEQVDVLENTWKSSNPHPSSAEGSLHNGDTGNGGLARASSDLSLYTRPIRRRSFRQPGIATRSERVMVQDEMELERPSRPTTPNRLMLEDDDDEMHLPLPPRFSDPNQPRALTPNEDDYKQIGAFKLGSLRIMNGAASPCPSESPSDKKSSKGINITGDKAKVPESPSRRSRVDGYFAKKLGSSFGKNVSQKVDEVERRVREEGVCEEEAKPPTPPKDTRGKDDSIKSPVATRTTFHPYLFPPTPAATSPQPQKADAIPAADSGSGTIDANEESLPTIETAAISESQAKEPSLDEPPAATEKSNATITPRIELPVECLAALEFSPLLLELPTLPTSPDGLMTTSKLTAVEDDLFEDDRSDVFSNGPEVLDVRNEPTAKPTRVGGNRPKLDPVQRGSRTVSRTDSGFISSPTSDGASTHRSSRASAVSSKLTKADSGYSSNVSLRSFHSHSNHNSLIGKPPVPEKDFSPSRTSSTATSARPRASVLLDNLSVYGTNETDRSSVPPSAPDRDAPPPPVPAKDFPPLSPTTSLNSSRFSRSSIPSHVAAFASQQDNSQRRSRRFMTPSPIPSQTASEPAMIAHRHSQLPARAGTSITTPISPGSGASTPAPSPTYPAEKPKKVGRLRRLLSTSGLRGRNSRVDLGLHPNRPLDAAHVSEMAEHVDEDRPSARSSRAFFSTGTMRLSVRGRESKDTLMTIFSAVSGSGMTEGEKTDATKAKENEDMDRLRRRGTTSAYGSREQLPAQRRERPNHMPPLTHRNTIHEATFSYLQHQQLHQSASYSNFEHAAPPPDRDSYYHSGPESPRKHAASIGRTMSFTSDAERDIHLRVAAQRMAVRDSRTNSRASSRSGNDAFSPPNTATTPNTAYHRARAVSRSGPLRVPIPLRPNSRSSTREREGIQDSADVSFAALSRTSSRSSMRSSSGPVHPGPTGEEGLSRSNSISSDTGGPGWQPMLARRDSISSYSDIGGTYGPPPSRPASAAGHRTMSLRGPPPLRHRNSFDGPPMPRTSGHFEAQSRQLAAELGKGRHTVYGSPDPWSTSNASYGPNLFPWDQYGQHASMKGRHAPYVPRQKRSTNKLRAPAPYRVLHSYNSPAYKGAPIWG